MTIAPERGSAYLAPWTSRGLDAAKATVVAQGLVQSKLIVVAGVNLDGVVQLPKAKAQEEAQALAFHAADPRLGA